MKKRFLKFVLPAREDGVYVPFFKMSRFSVSMTLSILVACLIMGVYLVFGSSGSYLAWWIPSFFMVLLFFVSLSTPVALFINDNVVEVHCAVEVTRIERRNIRSVTTLERQYVQTFYFPIFASMGFLGHNGYYLDIKEMQLIKMNATNFEHLILIRDNKGRCYVINDCGDGDLKILKR